MRSPTTALLPVGTAVPHMYGCICVERDASTMIGEREAFDGLLLGLIADLLFKRLRVAGIATLRWSRPRWNSAGDPVGPEMTIWICEAQLVWRVHNQLLSLIDETVVRAVQSQGPADPKA